MQTETGKKTCMMCCTEIPQGARKCPHCHHFQDRAARFLHHPAVEALGVFIPLAVMLAVVMVFFARILDAGENYETYRDQINITDDQIVFGESKSGRTVGVVGTIKNTSPIGWNEIQFHVDFLNAAGQRMDVGHKQPYGFYLPADGTSSFKVSFPMEFAESSYAKAIVRVATAKDARARW